MNKIKKISHLGRNTTFVKLARDFSLAEFLCAYIVSLGNETILPSEVRYFSPDRITSYIYTVMELFIAIY